MTAQENEQTSPPQYDPQLHLPLKKKETLSDQFSTLSWLLSYFPGFHGTVYLVDHFGARFLVHVLTGQHLLRGLAGGLSNQAIPYLLKEVHCAASRVNIYQTVIKLAFSCKILIGFFSDTFPLSGYRQMPLLVLASLAGLGGYVLICALPAHVQTAGLLVFLFFLTRLQCSTCEVLTEAQVSIRMREDPEHGPALLPFLTGGVVLLEVFASVVYGLIMEGGSQRNPRSAIGVCAFLAAPVLFTSMLNFQGEKWVDKEEIAKNREEMLARPALVALSVSSNILAIVLAFSEMSIPTAYGRLIMAVACLGVLLAALTFVVRREVALATMTYTVMIAGILEVEGATFYFFTDSAAEYPEGPHFSPIFYNAVLQAISGVFLLCGLVFYSRYMQSWTYRNSLALSVVITSLLFLPDVVLFSRLNRKLHIPDEVFVIGTQALKSLPQTWDYIIIMSLTAKFCPEGMEATIFALLSSFASFGAQVNNYFGAFLLDLLEVNPSGRTGEGAQFKNLWLATLIAAVFPLISLPLIYKFIPNVSQSEALFDDPSSRGTISSAFIGSTRRGRHSLLAASPSASCLSGSMVP